MSILPCSFYEEEVTIVARALLGMRLVHRRKGKRLSGIILETEAYRGEEDLACHAKSGKTKRNSVMYGPAGNAYIYFTYGMHWCLNAVTGAEGYPAAVLIRSLWPEEGLEQISERRGQFPRGQWCNGPAKLCQAFYIDGTLNGASLCGKKSELWIEEGVRIQEQNVARASRIGIGSVPEPWRSLPWRFTAELPDEYKND